MMACFYGHVPVVDRLVGLGCDLNLQNDDGETALMLACQYDYAEIVKILLAHGADSQIKDNKGKMAIDLTQSQEIEDIIQGDLLALLSFFFHLLPKTIIIRN